MKVLICGSRDWENGDIIFQVLDGLFAGTEYEEELIVIHGDANGADSLAKHWCRVTSEVSISGHRVKEVAYPADWDRYGKRAGFMRNSQMLAEGKPDIVIGFMNGSGSKGTTMMLDLAKAVGVKTYRIQEW